MFPFFLACSLCTGQDVELLPWRTVETRPLALQHGRLPCCKGLGFRASACVAWVWFHVCPLHGFTWVGHHRCRSALRHCVQRGSAGGSALLDAPKGDTHWRQLKVELGWARRIVRGSVLFGAGCSSRCGMPTIKLRLAACNSVLLCQALRPFPELVAMHGSSAVGLGDAVDATLSNRLTCRPVPGLVAWSPGSHAATWAWREGWLGQQQD